MQPVGGRLDSNLKFLQRSRARIEKIQSDLSREQSLLQVALENLERLRDDAATADNLDGCRRVAVEERGKEVE